MDLLDWLNLGLRWFHLVVAIGWIGVSLYFMWLDAALTPPATPRPGVTGELWMVHSGGFYVVERRRLGPGEMPAVLHWFRWEAALTAISGLLLLAVVYYASPGAFLVDPAVSGISPGAAVILGLGVFAAAWVLYDLLWASRLGRDHARAAAVVSWLLLFAVAWGLCRVLSGRAAYVHVGGLLGVIMALNVWVRILPAQREMIAATREGRAPDGTLGARAKQRSTHNSYVTFPVIFTMLSNHYPGTYGHRLNWLVLWLLILLGAGVRHYWLGLEHRRRTGWVLVPVAAALLALVWLTRPAVPVVSAAGARVPFPLARQIVAARCVSCHSASPTDDVFRVAPGGVVFDTPEQLRLRADAIRSRAVVLRNMPLANKTGMTEGERELLGRWIDQGARVP